jgi:predicted nuclease with TOPRIM domain
MMLRAVIVFLILAAIAGYFAYRQYSQDQVTATERTQQINELNSRVQKLENDNSLLRDQLATVQDENYNLKGYNDVLEKALETARITGKVPQIMPYPPK